MLAMISTAGKLIVFEMIEDSIQLTVGPFLSPSVKMHFFPHYFPPHDL